MVLLMSAKDDGRRMKAAQSQHAKEEIEMQGGARE
jgi:hypothetical protein